MSVGVQSFDDGLLRRMCRYEKYGSGAEILERLQETAELGIFKTLNADMIFNYPTQTREMLRYDLEQILKCGCSQVTFYPLMVSPAVRGTLTKALGKVDYSREREMYEFICGMLTGGPNAPFRFGSAWTFSRTEGTMIDEYVVDYEEYAAAGSGGMSFLDGKYLREIPGQHLQPGPLRRTDPQRPLRRLGIRGIQQTRCHALSLYDAALRAAA